MKWSVAGWAAAGFVGAGVLLRFPPERYTFYPRCPIYETFGWLCPGCGATRAAAALLHGRVAEALRWNALFVLAVFGVVIYGLMGRGPEGWRRPPGWTVAALLAVTVVFGLARNVV